MTPLFKDGEGYQFEYIHKQYTCVNSYYDNI